MQSVSSRIWTRVAVSISYDDNYDTTGTSIIIRYEQDATQGQFFKRSTSNLNSDFFFFFFSPRLVGLPSLKNPTNPRVYK